MNDETLAEKFRALGDPTRMKIFRTLMESSGQGAALDPTVGDVCRKIAGAAKINSTISHHLKELRRAGLIDVRRRGRNMVCRPKPDGVRDMLSFLLDVE